MSLPEDVSVNIIASTGRNLNPERQKYYKAGVKETSSSFVKSSDYTSTKAGFTVTGA